MSEKNNDDESSLRPVERDTSGEGTDWMGALGVGWTSKNEPTASAAEAEPGSGSSEPGAHGEDWMAQLGGSEPPAAPETEPVSDLAVDEPAWTEPSLPAKGRRRDWLLPAAMTGILVVLVGGFGLLVVSQLSGGDDAPADLAAELDAIEAQSGAVGESGAPMPTGAPPGSAEFECEGSEAAGTVTGSGAGDTKSVAGVVLAFQHAYYSERDAKKALALTSDDSPLVNASALQEGIDSVPKGTEHCVSITADGATARVEITESRPSDPAATFVQEVTTSRDGDRVEIVGVAQKED